uniref:Uncharacterized protein n=1 Tax=Opuntia streptacantha TaxID=393608 RepID=A0A7C9A0V8_OPUST
MQKHTLMYGHHMLLCMVDLAFGLPTDGESSERPRTESEPFKSVSVNLLKPMNQQVAAHLPVLLWRSHLEPHTLINCPSNSYVRSDYLSSSVWSLASILQYLMGGFNPCCLH